MARISLTSAAGLALLVAACSTSSSPSASSGAGGVRQISVTMTDTLRFEPSQFQIKADETVDFVVRNAGQIRHEFFLGDESAQAAHEKDMAQMGGMAHDESNGIFVDPGQTKTLRHTFTGAASVIAGCHEPGHYAAGMKAPITVN